MVYLGLSPVRTVLDMPMWSISVYHQYAQFSICQRFILVYCQSVFLSGVCATTDVGRTSRREFTLVREVRTTAVSRRLRKTDWCFYSVFVFQSTRSFTHSALLSVSLYAPVSLAFPAWLHFLKSRAMPWLSVVLSLLSMSNTNSHWSHPVMGLHRIS